MNDFIQTHGSAGSPKPAPAPDKLAADTAMGPVTLLVGDLDRMTAYYRDAVALQVLTATANTVTLGRGTTPIVVLEHSPALRHAASGSAGLYHTAILFDTQSSLAAALFSVASHAPGTFTGSADHLVSQAFYFTDPEGNGVELYWDRDRSDWSWVHGHVEMATVFLDPNGFLREHLSDQQREWLQGGSMPGGSMPGGSMPGGSMPGGSMPGSGTNGRSAASATAAGSATAAAAAAAAAATAAEMSAVLTGPAVVGHVHLSVGDVDTAKRFYVDTLGFDETAAIGNTAVFVSAGGYHHHMAMNVWDSRGAGPRMPALGLGRIDIQVPTGDDLGALKERLDHHGLATRDDGRTLRFDDPWRNALHVTTTAH